MTIANHLPRVAYFCMEYGLNSDLPIYAGGLGILAGDYLKSAGDLGLPVIGIGILWREGYTTQTLDTQGWPHDATQPLGELHAECTNVRVTLTIQGRDVTLAVWRVTAYGNAPLYLLEATGADSWITAKLYGGDSVMRVAQEMVLGIGGIRVLRQLGLQVDMYHFNEGHALFAATELLREQIARGLSFAAAWESVRQTVVFTTHTPVPAGNESHSHELLVNMGAYNGLSYEQMQVIGGDPFNMTVAGLRMAHLANGVAQLHGATARHMWREVSSACPIVAITNGVHAGTWQDPRIDAAYRAQASVWPTHQTAKNELLHYIKQATGRDLEPNVLLIGLARRMTPYKRNDLILQLPELDRLFSERQVQIVMAGKAHPNDHAGKELIQRIMIKSNQYPQSLVYLENYDIRMAQLLTRGCDVWLNCPRRPLEASGTSGMKAALNGVLNLSVLDGWWPEGCKHGTNGWQFGDGYEGDNQDGHDLAALQKVMLQEVLPTYYQYPLRWQQMMYASIQTAEYFTSHRMIQQYYTELYK